MTRTVQVRSYNRRTRQGPIQVQSYNRKQSAKRQADFNQVYLTAIYNALKATPRKFTTTEISTHFRIHPITAEKYLNRLHITAGIQKTTINGKTYWFA